MQSLRVMGYWAVLLLIICGTGGCSPSDTHADVEADPHFQKGRTLADSEDYKDAAGEYELALEDNPHSAAAHFELGWLYDTKLNDYAAAIYHYERHLLYDPQSKRAELVRDRIRGCKEELADNEFLMPSTRNMQRDLDKLNVENQALKKQVDTLNKQLAVAQAQLRALPQAQTFQAESAPERGPAPELIMPGVTPIPALAHPHLHVVQPHETFTSIALAYHLRTSLLMAANPRVNPRRLRVGERLNLP